MKKLDVNVLMIGNWIKHDPSEWSYRNNDNVDLGNIYFQWEDRDWVALCECTLSIEALSAIPLTEEILLKCGAVFPITLLKDCYFEGFGPLHNHKSSEWFILVTGKRVYIKYLHEFQNLFYILTKKHLQIKL